MVFIFEVLPSDCNILGKYFINQAEVLLQRFVTPISPSVGEVSLQTGNSLTQNGMLSVQVRLVI